MVCEKGIYNLVTLTQNDVVKLGLNDVEELEILKLKGTLVIKTKVRFLAASMDMTLSNDSTIIEQVRFLI